MTRPTHALWVKRPRSSLETTLLRAFSATSASFSSQPVVRGLKSLVDEWIEQRALGEGRPSASCKELLEVADSIGIARQGDGQPGHRPRTTLADCEVIDDKLQVARRRKHLANGLVEIVRSDQDGQRFRPCPPHRAVILTPSGAR